MAFEFVARNGVIALNNSIVTGSLIISNNVSIGTTVSSSRLQVSGSSNVMNVRGSGSVATSSIFTVDGAAGRLFSVNDSLSGSLFSVNTIAGLPVIEAFSDNTVRIGQYGQKALFVSQSRVGVGLETPTALLHLSSSVSGANVLFRVETSASSATLLVSSSGNIGVGLSNPQSLLHISGTRDSLFEIDGLNAYQVLYASASGLIGLGLSNPTASLHVSGTTRGVFEVDGANAIRAFFISSSGNIGVGTVAPSHSLDVSGSIRISNELIVTGSITGSIVTRQLVYNVVTASVSVDQNNFSPTGWNDTDPNKATTIFVSASNSLKITGLAGGSTGRIAIIRNSSIDRLIIIEDNSVSSTDANRFFIGDVAFLLPSASISLLYDGFTQKWNQIGASDGIGFNGYFDQFDDFLGGQPTTASSGIWGSISNGAGTLIGTSSYLSNTTERPMGTIEMSTGTTAAGRVHIGSTLTSSIQPGFGHAIMLTRLAPQQLVSAPGTQNSQIWAGWHDAVGRVYPTRGVYWQYSSGSSVGAPNSNLWTGVIASGSVSSSVNTGPTVDTNYNWLGIYVNGPWNRATFFYSTDSTTWNIASDVLATVSITASQIGFGVTINKNVGVTPHLVSVDMLGHMYDTNRG